MIPKVWSVERAEVDLGLHGGDYREPADGCARAAAGYR